MAVKNIIFKVSADTKNLNASLTEAQKKLDALNASATKTVEKFEKLGSGFLADNLVKNLNAINASLSSLNAVAATTAKNARSLSSSFEAAAKSSNKIKSTTVSVVKAPVQKFAAFAPDTEKTQQFLKNISTFGKKTGEDLKGTQDQLKKTNKAVQENETTWSKFVQTVRAARTVLAAIYVGNEVINFGKSILNAAGNYEVLNIQFKTFFKSSEQAKLILQDIQDLAVATPFKTSELQDSARILSAYGFTANELVPTLERLGNVVSGTNIPIQQLSLVFGQVKAAGRLMGQDLLQLVNAGFNPLQIIAKRTGESMLSLRKRMEQGKISFEEINAAFIVATENGGIFNNLSKELGLTFEGRVNALVERSEIFKRKLGENLLPTAKAVVEGLLQLGVALKNIGGFVKDNSAIFIALSGSLLSLFLNTKKYTLSLLTFKALRQVVNIQNAYANVLQRISIIQTNAEAAATGRAAGAKRAYAVATGLATSAVRGLTAAFKANPLGYIITALTTAIALWDVYNERQAEAAKKRELVFPNLESAEAPQNRVNEAVRKTTKAIEDQVKAITNLGISDAERSKRLEEFNKQYGTSIKDIDKGITLEAEKKKQLKNLEYELARARQTPIDKAAQAARIKQTEIEIAKLDENIAAQKELIKTETERLKNAAKQVSPTGVSAQRTRSFLYYGGDPAILFKKTSEEIKKEAIDLADVTTTAVENIPESFKGLDFATSKIKGFGGVVLQSEVRLKELEVIQENLRQGLDNTADSFENTTGKGKEYNDVLKELRNNLQVLVDKFEEAKLLTIDVEINAFKGEDEATQKLIASLKNDKLLKELELQFNKEFQAVADKRNDAIDKLEQELKKGTIDQKTFNILANEAENYFIDQTQIVTDTLKERLFASGLQYEQALGEITAAFNKRKEEAKVKLNIDEVDNQLQQLTETIDKLKQETDKLFQDLDKTVTKKQFKGIESNIRLVAEQQKIATKRTYEETINRLNIEEDANLVKLSADGATIEEGLANEKEYNDKRREALRKYEKDTQDITNKTNEQIVESDKQRKERQIKLWQDIGQEVFKISQEIAQLQIQQAENAINAQQKRVDKAKEIAEQGNAEVLQLEEERLDKLVKLKQKYVAQQQALALAELVANSIIAVAKAATAEPPAAVPYIIAANIAAIIAGIAAAKTQIAAAGSFETGGYTGDGGRKEPAGVVHKGEFVFTQEKTKKYRTLFEEIHKGRDPFIAKGLSEKVVVINNSNMDEKLGRIEKAIRQQKGMELHISEDGIHGIVSHIEWKNKRIANKAK